MKLLLILMAVISAQLLNAQTDSNAGKKKLKKYNARIETLTGEKLKGEVSSIDTNGIHLVTVLKKNNNNNGIVSNSCSGFISYSQLQKVSFKRKNTVLRSSLIGLGIGAATGVIIGFASGNDRVQPYYTIDQDPLLIGNFFVAMNNAFAMTAGEKALAGGVGLGAMGAIAGAVFGAVAKKKFIIGGKKENYRNLQEELMKRLVVK
ncbi:MAG: hypothetical protein EPN92_10115 [Chitinophagaceae bacterium]|nr:MAG: hypothetical protein EPN92_10115 [Chitinophagaceae bacterium]